MNRSILLLVLLLSSMTAFAQYEFTDVVRSQCTEVKSQGRTGTCWSFATASFLESEVSRKLGKKVDLSEMYVVKETYKDKARNYVLRKGKANFSQGSLSHDLIRVAAKSGLMPESALSGYTFNKERYDHSELASGLKGFLDGVIKQKRLTPLWDDALEAILDVYVGETPKRFTYEGKQFTPSTFVDHIGLKPEDYISFASFSHHPFYDTFILEVPDNYSNGSYYNIPIDKMEELVDHALKNGHTVAWDGDVSEKGFGRKEGIAILPKKIEEDMFENPVEEKKVTQQLRQDAYMNYSTTDDHLMHIVGIAKDQKNNSYYIVKNSWGDSTPYGGYLYMSKAYFKMKTVGVMVSKDALPAGLIK